MVITLSGKAGTSSGISAKTFIPIRAATSA